MQNIDKEAMKWLNNNELSYKIWNNKYRFKNESFYDWLLRVSGNNPKIAKLIEEKKFLFGGRTLANRGTGQGSLSNCYASGRVDDDLDSIMQTATNIAKTFKAQGGQGISLTNIRPKGAKIGENFISDGIVPFMEIFNTVTASISQGSHRRGALMMSLSAEHPQIEEFIKIKEDLNKINNANLSIEIPDRFMEAVKRGEKYHVENTFKGGNPDGYEVDAPKIYNMIMHSAWKSGEPGVMFMDRFSNYNLMEKIDSYQIHTSNPCGEQPLPKNFACNLCSINLSEYILHPFTHDAEVNYNALRADIATIVEAMDDIIDENAELHALPEQCENTKNYRNIGIGLMGVHDALIKAGIVYGSVASHTFIGNVCNFLFQASVEASSELAKKRGSFAAYDEAIWDSDIIKRHFRQDNINELKKNGLRNCSLLSIAPTGSIGTMLNISTGIEPWFNLHYTRHTKSLDGGTEQEFEVWAPVAQEANTHHWCPETLITSGEINWRDRVLFQASAQDHIDTAISSTVNLPNDITEEEIADLYKEAWDLGLKGITIFRDGCRDGILTNITEKKEEPVELPKFDYLTPVTRTDLGTTLEGVTNKYRNACSSLYVTINNTQAGDIVEVFVNPTAGGSCTANLQALSRQVSDSLRSGIKVSNIIESLEKIQCPSCMRALAKGKSIDGKSCGAIIARCLRERYEALKLKNGTNYPLKVESPVESVSDVCPECGKPLHHVGGCMECECGYSKCG